MTDPAVTPPRAARRRLRRHATGLARWPLGGWVLAMLTAVAMVSLVAMAVGGWALQNVTAARTTLVDQIAPAATAAERLTTALLNQESGLRGFALTGRQDFLELFFAGRAQERLAAEDVQRFVTGLAEVGAELAAVRQQAALWRAGYAEPTIAGIRSTGPLDPAASATEGRIRFDAVRGALAALSGTLAEQQREARAELDRAADILLGVCIAIAVAVLLITAALAAGLRAAAISPLARLASATRRVTDGDFSHEVSVSGPREVVELGEDVELMRRRILAEVAESHAQSRDLARSNAELEQFAYVASHDLQEPLRKVAGFCELLERRYAGQLDERADQYIAFAVDGAKRMQALINDLLGFSCVGRITRERTLVDCDALLAQATANLDVVIKETGAEITSNELPTVVGEGPLLTTVFQNLVGNAVKFHGDAAPRVHVGVQRQEEYWEFSVADNGIGIEPEYAERIFVIFQRLHPRGAYGGTGIGLAMCRKIIEYHGGSIWLDTAAPVGTTIRFTLPTTEEPAE